MINNKIATPALHALPKEKRDQSIMSIRKLKHHEAKLLKKVDFLEWKKEQSIREIQVLRRYHIQDRADYVK